MEFRLDRRGTWAVLAVAGDLDLGTADDVREAAQRAVEGSDAPLALDLAGVAFIDSSGLRTLLELRTDGGGPTLVAPSEPVRTLLSLTMMDDAFPIVDDVGALEGV